MNLRETLSERINMNSIYEICSILYGNDALKQDVYRLMFDENETVAYQAAWVFTHLNKEENKWLFDKQNELIDEALSCKHPGKKRLILGILYRQPLKEPIRVDFLDFCLEGIVSKKELPAVNAICIKLAYEQCRTTPELANELKMVLEIMEEDWLPPSVRATRKNILRAFRSLKIRQKE